MFLAKIKKGWAWLGVCWLNEWLHAEWVRPQRLARDDEFETSLIGRLALGGAHPTSVLKVGLIFDFGGLRAGVDKQAFKHQDSLSWHFLDLLIQGCGLWT